MQFTVWCARKDRFFLFASGLQKGSFEFEFKSLRGGKETRFAFLVLLSGLCEFDAKFLVLLRKHLVSSACMNC